eukprot:461776-Prorocentrum_lima.AAC.1
MSPVDPASNGDASCKASAASSEDEAEDEAESHEVLVSPARPAPRSTTSGGTTVPAVTELP